MKVSKLRIRNFRNIGDTTLDAGNAKFIVVRGANRNGKTSIAEALSLALTPTTWGLSAKGDGYARKIKRGEPKATLEVDLQGASRLIRRTVTLNVNSTGRTQSSADVNDPSWHPGKFDKLLEDKKTALGIAVNTRQFMSMIYSGDEKAQKNLLAQLVLPAHYEFPKETIADAESAIGQGAVNFDGEPFAVIEQAYKKLFNERQETNKRVKEFLIPEALPVPQGVNSEALNSKLSALREARRKWVQEREAAARKANEEALKKERTQDSIATMEAILRVSKDSLRLLQEAILPNPQAVADVAGKKDERQRLVAEQQRILYAQEAAKKEQARLNQLSNGATCPTCEQEINEPKMVELAKNIVAERSRLTEEYAKVTQAIGMLGDIDAAIAKLDKHSRAVMDRAEILSNVEEQTRALNQAKERADKDTGGLFDPKTFDQTISETDKSIEAILQQIQPVIAAEERAKDIAAKREQLKRLEDKAARLDKLVKYFDKDGIKAKLIAQYIGAFEIKCNKVLRAWDYSCSLSIEPFKFEITDYRNVSTPLIDLSGAEELMFYAAFQCAVSRTAGIDFVVIDRVDTLLPDLRPALYRNLYTMVEAGTLDQVILLVADTSAQVPKLENAAFFVVEEGSIRRLGL
jgi:DNA repair exonuclease SbcCD ATPase subunit